MPTSLVLLKENGFWATDRSLKVWLGYLVVEIRRLADCPPWLEEIAGNWYVEALSGPAGGVEPGLDNIVTDERRPVLERICRRALQRLRREMRAGTDLVSHRHAGLEISDPQEDVVARTYFAYAVGGAFLALVRGEMHAEIPYCPFIPKNRF